jgi:hypothetical protein
LFTAKLGRPSKEDKARSKGETVKSPSHIADVLQQMHEMTQKKRKK